LFEIAIAQIIVSGVEFFKFERTCGENKFIELAGGVFNTVETEIGFAFPENGTGLIDTVELGVV
jgi:hypothetical protein